MINKQLKNLISDILLKNKTKKIKLSLIESKLHFDIKYEELFKVINELMLEGVLIMVKSTGYNHNINKLPNSFTIVLSKLREDIDREIHKKSHLMHKSISLDFYLKNNIEYWNKDKKYIDKINEYLNKNNKIKESTIPERSYLITGDEKWLQEKNGLKILDRLNILKLMKLSTNPDPLMFAINKNFNKFDTYKHIIVENKSIYYLLLDLLETSNFTTLIYGSGWKIASDLKSFNLQFPFNDKEHSFYYFGDFDNEGIKIWSYLNDKYKVLLAKPFYKSLFKCTLTKGKQNQTSNNHALEQFCLSLDEYTDWIKKVLSEGYYIPQEALKSDDLIEILNGYR